MSQTFRAIYEHGVLRPLVPLELPEAAVVECTPVTAQESEGLAEDDEQSVIDQQKRALQALMEKIEKIPQVPNNDGLHGRDHDQILYGKPY